MSRFADDAGYFGFGHPEHHLQIEGFEISNDPRLMSMWLGRHSKRLRVITCGFVSTTHNPLRVAEDIATMDHMLGGRFGVGLVRGYQARWVENFKVRDELNAVGPVEQGHSRPTRPTANTSPSSSMSWSRRSSQRDLQPSRQVLELPAGRAWSIRTSIRST